MFDDGLDTITSQQQQDLENRILELYQQLKYEAQGNLGDLKLQRPLHVRYLYGGLGQLGPGYVFLDASRPWIVYWILNSLSLLGAPLPASPNKQDIIKFLSQSQHSEGGYVGGPNQIAHLAPTYAAVSSLVLLGGEEALSSVDRKAVLAFLERMCIGPEKGGGFTVHEGGEADMRACYTAIAVAHMLNLDKEYLVQKSGMLGYIRRCQTYEGGLGGEPGNEAHGGYTSCGLAALALTGHLEVLDIPRLLKWLTQRQGWFEGGFNGRTNKLVDGCYSFWQAGVFNVLRACMEPHKLFKSMPDPSEVSKEQEVVVPDLPFKLNPQTRTEQAQAAAEQADHAAAEHLHALNPDSPTPLPDADLIIETDAGANTAAYLNCLLVECSSEALCPPQPGGPHIHHTHHHGGIAAGDGKGGGDGLGASSGEGEGGVGWPLYNTDALQLWVLRCCQGPKGGLRDKPGKSVDFYHTCYCLSGLSAAQHLSGRVLGLSSNLLTKNDPLCNVSEQRLNEALEYYRKIDLEQGQA